MLPLRLRSLPLRLVFLLGLVFASSAAHAQRQPERIGRGVIAERGVDTGSGGTNNWTGAGINQVYVGWRLFATDPESVAFNVYRSASGGAAVKLNASPITISTNYVDTTATLTVPNDYFVKPVINGVEGAASEAWTLPANTTAEPCFTIPMPALSDGAHEVHLAWVGDLDGDGFTDIVVDRMPSVAGGTIRVEGYSLRTRSRLWTIDLGPNGYNSGGDAIISAGQNDGVTVYDFDGDGKCEVVTKSTIGTIFGDGGTIPGSGTTVYLSVVDGTTGRELSRRQIATGIGAANDSKDIKNIGVGFIDGIHPALVTMDELKRFTTYDVNPSTFALSVRWGPSGGGPSHGHGIRISDIDGDGKDEVCDIGVALDDDGTTLYQVDINHGDRYHIADIDPDRPGLECYGVQQDNPTQLSQFLYDALTGQVLWRKYATTMVDNGRGNIGSIDSGYTGMQCWSVGGGGVALMDQFGNNINANQPYPNFSIWWDADVLREQLNEQLIDKWNVGRQLTGYKFHGADFGPRSAVPFYGDFLGDWREEIVTFSGDGTQLVVFSTTKVATLRYYTLLQDPQYRDDLTIKGYMQSHHPGFYFGLNMPRPPRAPIWAGDLTWVGNASGNVWDNATARWKNSATGAATTYADGQSVLFDLTGVSSTAVTLNGTLSPSQVVVHAPKGQAYTFGGTGTLSGAMTLTKGGQGSLTLGGNHAFTGQTLVSEGTLLINGSLTGSAVRVDSRGILGGTGAITQAVSFPEVRGGLAPGGIGAAGTLTLSGGLSETGGTVNTFDLAATTAPASNDRVAVTGNLTLSGANIIQINPLTGTLAAGGTYTLFTYTGTFTGTLSSLVIRGAEAYPCTLANTGSAITLTVGAMRTTASVTWAGGSAGAWTLNGGSGWLKAGVTDGFVTGDTVTFDDTGSATPAVTLSTAVLPASTVVNSTANYTFSGAGSLGGSGGLTKSGTGTLAISTANTFTGPTAINGGVLSVTFLADGGQPSPLGASTSNLALNGGTLRLTSGSTSTFRGVTLGASGGTLDLPSSSSTLNLTGVITGTGSLSKTGAGLLILNAVNTYSGGTIIQSGKVVLTASRTDYSPTSPIQYGLGTGPVTLQGTLSLADTSTSDLDGVSSQAFWPIIVPAGASGRLEANGRMTVGGSLTGAGDFTFFTPYVRTDVTGNWSAFTGRLYVVTDGNGGDFRIANSAGLTGAWLDLAANVYAYSRAGSGTTTLNIGSLSGAAGSVLNAGTGSGLGANQPAHWKIGARGDETTFAGVISGTALVTKQGTGALTLTGANTYTGATIVSAGKLVLAGGSLSGTNVTVASGAAFGGSGSVTGTVTFSSGSTFLAGSAAPLAITGNLVLGGSVTVAAAPGATLGAGTYPIITYTGTLTGTPAFTWSGPGFTGTFNTSVPGQVSVTLQDESGLPPTNLTALAGDAQATLSWSASTTAISYTVRRSTTNGGPYTDVAAGITATSYTDSGLTNSRTYYYVVAAVAANGGTVASSQASVSVGPPAPYAHWRLDETTGSTAADSSGNGRTGTLVNSPAWTTGRLNNGLGFTSAANHHVTLPSGVVQNVNDFTLSVWVNPTTQATWTRVIDFGTGTTNYLFLATRYSSANLPRFAIRTPAVAEQVINSSTALATGAWTHLTVTLSGSTGTLYLNGVAVGTNTAMTLTPASLGLTTLNYLGKSQFSDPYYNGTLDELQIYARALTAAEVAALATPPAAPSGLNAVAGDAQVALSWSTVPGAGAYSVKRASIASGPYATVATGLTSAAYTDTGLSNGVTYYYAVTAHQSVAESARSAAASATPLSLIESRRATHFGSPSATGSAADLADPDADGLANLLEYALHGDPQSAADAPLPILTREDDMLHLVFARIADPSLTYTVEATDDLATTWTALWTSTGATNTAGPVTVADPAPLAEHPRRFLRLRITR